MKIDKIFIERVYKFNVDVGDKTIVVRIKALSQIEADLKLQQLRRKLNG